MLRSHRLLAHFSTQPLLSNTKILDLSRIIVGPYATMILSDFGA